MQSKTITFEIYSCRNRLFNLSKRLLWRQIYRWGNSITFIMYSMSRQLALYNLSSESIWYNNMGCASY